MINVMTNIKKLTLYRFTLILSLTGLALTVISFAFPRYPVGVLSLYFFVLWLLWIGCAFIKLNNKTLKLILLWVINY